MNKIILLSSALCLFASYPANAEVSLNVNLGEPVYYAQPYRGYVMQPDYPSEHYDHHRHGHNDYWAGRQQQEREHAAHDNGNRDRR